MSKICPFDGKYHCDIWLDYMIDKDELEQANELLGYNWKEICHLYDRIDVLEKYIRSIGGEIPSKY